MLGGCQKKMYYVRNTGSRLFTEAYFVMRAGADYAVCENDLAAEADRIIRQRFPSGKRRWQRPRHFTAIMVVVGVVIGAAVMWAVTAG